MKERRKLKKMTQQEVSVILGLTPQAYGMYEQGSRVCKQDALIKIANLFDTTTDYLLDVTDDPKKPPSRIYNYTIAECTPVEIAVITAVRDFKMTNGELIQLLALLKGSGDHSGGSHK